MAAPGAFGFLRVRLSLRTWVLATFSLMTAVNPFQLEEFEGVHWPFAGLVILLQLVALASQVKFWKEQAVTTNPDVVNFPRRDDPPLTTCLVNPVESTPEVTSTVRE